MRLRSQVIGALNLFHTDPNALAPAVTQIGQALADVATIGLIQERALHQHDSLVDHLRTALDSRVIIEQAKGVLAERHGIDPGTAFTLLRRHARKHGQRLTDLAAAVINGSTTATELLPAHRPPRPESDPGRVKANPSTRWEWHSRATTRGQQRSCAIIWTDREGTPRRNVGRAC